MIWRTCAPICVLVLCAGVPVFGQDPGAEIPSTTLTSSRGINSAPLAACSVSAESSRPAGEVVAQKQSSASCVMEGDKAAVVGRFVSEKLASWQRRLKLENWTIAVVMSRRTDLKPKTLGGIRWDKGKKTAVMAVLDPAEYRLPFREMLADIEFTIVHELVHLELASLPRSEASRSNEEHAVNRLTEALLGLANEK